MRKLEKVKELVERLNYRLYLLKNHGFQKIKGSSGSSPHIYINKKLGVVVKRPYLTWVDAPVPKMACPTLVIRTNDLKWGRLSTIFIQPLVDTSEDSRWKAFSVLQEQEDQGYDCGGDLRESNCGLYRRKPIVIDW